MLLLLLLLVLQNEDISLKYFCVFQVSHAKPNLGWYAQMLAARDVLFSFWISHTSLHSASSTAILVLICNVLAIMDLRFLTLRDAPGSRKSSKTTKTQTKTSLGRSQVQKHMPPAVALRSVPSLLGLLDQCVNPLK